MAGRKKKGLKGVNLYKDPIELNTATFYDYLNRFQKIATSMFEWKNLPDGMDARYLERTLYYTGTAALLLDPEFGFINTRAVTSGRINIYGLPTSIKCFSYEYEKEREVYVGFKKDDEEDRENAKKTTAILVLNNFEKLPTEPSLQLFALRLTEAQRSIDMNIKQMKFPRIVLTDKSQEFTMRNLVNQIDDNELNIFADKNILSPDQIRSIDTHADYVADKLTEIKREIWNEALTFLGISNLDTKRERMITSETDSKNELINLNLQSYLAPRKEACRQFNELFGTNVDVTVRSDLHNLVKEMDNAFTDIKNEVGENLVENAIKDVEKSEVKDE